VIDTSKSLHQKSEHCWCGEGISVEGTEPSVVEACAAFRIAHSHRKPDTDAKLSHLRQDAATALSTYLRLREHTNRSKHCNLAALGYITAQAKYTLACHEAQQGLILPYVEVPDA
jgi:hypothetical protein